MGSLCFQLLPAGRLRQDGTFTSRKTLVVIRQKVFRNMTYFWCMPASASRPNANINNATSDWSTATAWPHLIGWCKKIRKADWLMMTSDAVENEWKYPICPAKNPALSGYKIKFLYIFIWVNMLRHRFAAAFGGSFAHGSAKKLSPYLTPSPHPLPPVAPCFRPPWYI